MGSPPRWPRSIAPLDGSTTCYIPHFSQHRRPRPSLFREGVQMIAAQTDAIDKAQERRPNQAVPLLCWQCGASLAEISAETRNGSGTYVCPGCTAATQYRDG